MFTHAPATPLAFPNTARPMFTQAPATPLAFPNTARPMFTQAFATPLAFPNTVRPILLKRLLRLSRFQTPRALYYSSFCYASRVSKHCAPYITQACTPRSSRVSKHRAPYITQAFATPLAFPNTARPIVLKRLLRLSRFQTPRALYYSSFCYASRVSKHRAPYITQAPATQTPKCRLLDSGPQLKIKKMSWPSNNEGAEFSL